MASITRLSEPDSRLMIFMVTGAVTAQQVLAQIISFLQETPTEFVLWDFRAGTLAAIPSHGLKFIVDEGKKYAEVRKGGRTAIVCSSDLDFGLSRMFQTFAEMAQVPFQIEIFRSVEEAGEWLDVAKCGG